MLEAREHAEARGRAPYARLGTVLSGRSRREPGQAAAVAAGQFATLRKEAGGRSLGVLTGATGILGPTREERDWLAGLKAAGAIDTVRATPNMLGASVEATFPSMVALAALALSKKAFYRSADETGFEPAATTAPEAILVNAWGSWRGEGMGTGAARHVTGKEGVMGSEGQGFPRPSGGGDHRHGRRLLARRRAR